MTAVADNEIEQNEAETVVDWRAPYVAYATLTGFIDTKLGANPLPPRIDRGFLDSYAGSVQAMLLATLKTMRLIDSSGAVEHALKEAVRSPALRKRVFKTWAEGFYSEQLVLAGQNATAQMLYESFSRRKLNGSTLRKAVQFYLGLVEDVGLDNSPHFKAPKQTTSGASRPRKKTPPTATAADTSHLNASAPSGELLEVNFGDAGRVQVVVDVKWLQLPLDTFAALRSVLSDLEKLARVGSDQPQEQLS